VLAHRTDAGARRRKGNAALAPGSKPQSNAPMRECSGLDEVRTCIDDVDRRLIKLLAERRAYVVQASKFKESKADVRAPARVEQVISKVRMLAGAEGIEPDLVEALYRRMIEGFIEIESAAHRGRE
jgi:chorismate mutase